MSAAGLGRGRAARRRRRRRPASSSTPRSPPAPGNPFPLGILAVNLIGALALGLVAGAALDGEALVDRRRRRDRLLHHLLHLDARLAPPRATPATARLAWLNIGLSLVAGFAAVALGHWLGGVL